MQRASDAGAEVLAEIQRGRELAAQARGVSVDELDQVLGLEAERARSKREAAILAAANATVQRHTMHLLPLREEDREAVTSGAIASTEAARHVRTWLDGTGSALVLCGGVGTGKTIAATWALREAQRRSMANKVKRILAGDVEMAAAQLMVSALPSVVDAVTATVLARRVDPWKQDLAANVTPLALGVPFLVVDDLGTERTEDPRFTEALFRLVDERQGKRTRTLITTNLRRADIRPRYGDRIADRLNHIGRAVEIKGASMRRKGEL